MKTTIPLTRRSVVLGAGAAGLVAMAVSARRRSRPAE